MVFLHAQPYRGLAWIHQRCILARYGCKLPSRSCYVQQIWSKDRYYIGYIILIVGTALQTATSNRTTFILERFFLGVAAAWYGSNIPLLISKIAYPTHRGIASSFYNCGWYVGSLIEESEEVLEYL